MDIYSKKQIMEWVYDFISSTGALSPNDIYQNEWCNGFDDCAFSFKEHFKRKLGLDYNDENPKTKTLEEIDGLENIEQLTK